MSEENNKYFQFPLCILAHKGSMGRLPDAIIRYGTMRAGVAALLAMKDDERQAQCGRWRVSVKLKQSNLLASYIGEEVLGVKFGSRDDAINEYLSLKEFFSDWEARNGNDPFVRLKRDLCFQVLNNGTLDEREFRVLLAIYSSIGAHAFSSVPLRMMRVRAVGCKSEAVEARERAGDMIPPTYTPKQIRNTVTRLHELQWFARVTPDPHGRKTYYSHRLSDQDLRERVFSRVTYSHTFATEQREKNNSLASRIREAKGKRAPLMEKGTFNGEGSFFAPEEGTTRAQQGRNRGTKRAQGGHKRGTARAPIIEIPLIQIP